MNTEREPETLEELIAEGPASSISYEEYMATLPPDYVREVETAARMYGELYRKYDAERPGRVNADKVWDEAWEIIDRQKEEEADGSFKPSGGIRSEARQWRRKLIPSWRQILRIWKQVPFHKLGQWAWPKGAAAGRLHDRALETGRVE